MQPDALAKTHGTKVSGHETEKWWSWCCCAACCGCVLCWIMRARTGQHSQRHRSQPAAPSTQQAAPFWNLHERGCGYKATADAAERHEVDVFQSLVVFWRGQDGPWGDEWVCDESWTSPMFSKTQTGGYNDKCLPRLSEHATVCCRENTDMLIVNFRTARSYLYVDLSTSNLMSVVPLTSRFQTK